MDIDIENTHVALDGNRYPNNEEQNPSPATTERKGLMLCCMRTAERYGDSRYGADIPKGTTITCDKCGQEVESTGGRAWKAK